MEWLRWYHGAISDDKWPLIARKSGQTVAVVIAVWAALLECVSQAKERGSVADFDPESMDALLQLPDGSTQAVVEALSSGKHPRIVQGRLVIPKGKNYFPSERWADINSAEWAELRLSIFERDSFTCQYCGKMGGKLECDHVVPVSRGGATIEANLATSCKECNRSKGAKSLEDWLQ